MQQGVTPDTGARARRAEPDAFFSQFAKALFSERSCGLRDATSTSH